MRKIKSELLQQIERSFSQIDWQRYEKLIEKRQAESLTPDEQNELISLSDCIESLNVDRIQKLAKLALIRNITITGKVSKLKLSERRFMQAVGMGVVREDSGKKKKGKQSGSALCRKALWQWCLTRLEVSKTKPPLEFEYGQGEDAVRRSPSEDLKIRREGGTPIKLARQWVVARCVREVFKELSAIAVTTDE